MDKQYEIFKENLDKINKYSYAIFILSFDEETICPKNDKEYSLDVINYLQEKILKITKSDEYYNNLVYLFNHKELLTEVEYLHIKKTLENIEKEKAIPLDLLIEGNKIASAAGLSWEKARDTLDYTEFEKNLEKLVDYNFKTIPLYKSKYTGYDVLLDLMEDDMTEVKYDEFFTLVEAKLLPLLKRILALPKKYNKKLDTLRFDISKQKELTKRICEMMGYNSTRGYIGETIHPFTSSANTNDVRTTTSYKEELLFSNIFSVMHEVGHALYELQNDPALSGTALFGGTSCAIHESQSRFYENYLGRSKEFIEFLYPILLEYFPKELEDITALDIYYYVNDVTSNLYRVEADELSYPFHVIMRYNIEKDLFNKKITVKDINNEFNRYMKEYFDITPKNMKEGCYQDVHWSSGFGYFPTYALGSAISAQVYHYLKKDINVEELMRNGNFKPINEWLKERIHKYGASVKNFDVIKNALNEEFNPNYYVEYLIKKFTKIYEL